MNVNSRIARANFTGYASGTIASFTGLRAAPLKVAAQIVPIQSGSGDPAPDNIRPIAGWSEVTISVADDSMEVQDTYTIPFGQTIYGGELDVPSGVLTVDKKIINANTKTWSSQSIDVYTTLADTDATITPEYPSGKRPVLCNIAKYSVAAVDNSVRWGGANNNKNIILRNSYTTSLSEWNEYITENDVYLVYYIEPITVQLTPTQIEQIIGTNNIFSDSGNVEVYYVTI